MRQRAALLRTIVQDRARAMLDEPIRALDALDRTEMQLLEKSHGSKRNWNHAAGHPDVREAVGCPNRGI